jgi:hypothetical protein
MTIYGYARVSTDGQTLDAQIAGLTAAGATKVYSEKQSGAKTDRAALARVLAVLASGDVLMVKRLDRLARSTRDLLNVLATVSERGAGFRSLDIRTSLCSPTRIPPGKGLARPETAAAFFAIRADSGRQRSRRSGSPAAKPRKVKDYSHGARKPASHRTAWWRRQSRSSRSSGEIPVSPRNNGNSRRKFPYRGPMPRQSGRDDNRLWANSRHGLNGNFGRPNREFSAVATGT